MIWFPLSFGYFVAVVSLSDHHLLHRPGRKGGNQTGRGVLSMQGLSYGVVRVDDENSLMSLTLQDCGQVLPGGKDPAPACDRSYLLSAILFIQPVCVSANMVVVKVDSDPYLCKTDEVGELCVSSNYTGASYWGLKGFSNHVFRVSTLYLYALARTCCTV